MGNPRNLRRASSEDEDEGDVFDDKSEISSGSDEEEEGLSREKGADASSSPIQSKRAVSHPEASPPATTVGQCRDSPAASPAHDKRQVADGAKNGADEKTHPQTGARPRGGVSREDSNRRRMKTTWQEDPSFVPRETRYFLHDDRRDGEEEEEDEAEELDRSQPDFSVPRSSQTRWVDGRPLLSLQSFTWRLSTQKCFSIDREIRGAHGLPARLHSLADPFAASIPQRWTNSEALDSRRGQGRLEARHVGEASERGSRIPDDGPKLEQGKTTARSVEAEGQRQGPRVGSSEAVRP
ncbi:hypothetical protein Emag_001691 [Eimeria magna]